MRENRLIVWLSLAVLFIALLNLPESISSRVKHAVREAVAPLQQGLSSAGRGLQAGWASVRGLGGLSAEHGRLNQEVSALRQEIRDLQALAAENDALRRQLVLPARVPRALLACEVIARDAEGWWQTLRLNKGRADGVAREMAVVATEGLVGRVVDVSEHTCEVLLVSDPACKVSALVQRTGTFGVLAGRGPAWRGPVVCRLDFINKNAAIRQGDEVHTSGIGGLFPKGLFIGYVEQVAVDRTGLYQYADVVSKADLGALQYVFVVRGRPPAALFPPLGGAAP